MHHRQFLQCMLAAVVSAAGTAGPAFAQVNLGGSASLGRLDYEIESNVQQNWSGSAKLVVLGADAALPNGFYGGLSHAFTNGGELDFSFQGTPRSSSKFKRRDSALTLGWSLENKLNTFVGLRTASTDIANSIDTRFKTSGVFAGLAYPLSFGPSHLSFSLGFGVNKGTWSDTGGPISDTTFGYSGGIKYAYTINPRLVASAGLKLQNYGYDFTEQGFGTLDESVRALEVGMSFNF